MQVELCTRNFLKRTFYRENNPHTLVTGMVKVHVFELEIEQNQNFNFERKFFQNQNFVQNIDFDWSIQIFLSKNFRCRLGFSVSEKTLIMIY